MKKKLTICALVLLNIFALAGCGQEAGEVPSVDGGDSGDTGGGGGGGGGGAPVVTSCEGAGLTCRLFVTMDTNFTNGALGATNTLDAACNSDSNKPTTGTYKALIMRTSRQPGSGWILYPNKTYTRKDGTTVVGSTSSGSIFTGVLSNPIVALGTDVFWLTGVSIGSSSWGYQASNTCTNYSSSSFTVNIAYGVGNPTDLEANFGFRNTVNTQVTNCDGSSFSTVANQASLLCVEQ